MTADTTITPQVTGLTVAEEPETWAAAGFRVESDGTCLVGTIRLDLVGQRRGKGVIGWTVAGLPEGAADDLDGFETRFASIDYAASQVSPPMNGSAHPNGVTVLDHFVLLTDDIGRTVSAAGGLGLAPKRWRDHRLADGTPVRQAFFVVRPTILELVGPTEPPSVIRPEVRSFGLSLVVDDFDDARDALGGHLSAVRPAVQPGRQIATVRHLELGLRTPLALMSPRPSKA